MVVLRRELENINTRLDKRNATRDGRVLGCPWNYETTAAIDSNYRRLLWLWFIQKAEITLQLPFASYAISQRRWLMTQRTAVQPSMTITMNTNETVARKHRAIRSEFGFPSYKLSTTFLPSLFSSSWNSRNNDLTVLRDIELNRYVNWIIEECQKRLCMCLKDWCKIRKMKLN